MNKLGRSQNMAKSKVAIAAVSPKARFPIAAPGWTT
jgi:hypothetical protein